jgi:hypothetical protein
VVVVAVLIKQALMLLELPQEMAVVVLYTLFLVLL